MARPTYEDLVAYARSNEGRVFQTVRGAEFQVLVETEVLYFVPCSSGKRRRWGARTQVALERFIRTGSTELGDYDSYHRSYLIPFIQSLLEDW